MRLRQQTPDRHTRERFAPTRRLPALPLLNLLGAAVLAGAGLALAAGPARADCAADIGEFDAALVAAQTGTASGAEMPATEHQEEVLSGSDATGEAPAMETAAGAPAGDVEAVSPHQREALRALQDDSVDAATRDSVALIVSEARAALQNGDEAACAAKMDAARALLREG